MIDRYVLEICPHKPSGDRLASQLAWWRANLGAFSLGTITGGDIARARDRLGAAPTRVNRQRAGATLNRYLAALSHAFTLAIAWGWTVVNPTRTVQRLREPRHTPRALTQDELQRLLEACRRTDRNLHAIALLALVTGMRKGEILHLTHEDVDLEQRHIRLARTKNGHARVVYLARPVVALLQDQLDGAPAAVRALFAPPRSFETLWRRARSAATLPHVRFHDLRHCAATALAETGASVPQLAAFLGHRTFTMAQRYVTLHPVHLAEHVDALAARFAPALDDPSPTVARRPGIAA